MCVCVALPRLQENTLAAYGRIPSKIMSSGQKTDVTLHLVRVGLFHMDLKLAKQKLDEATACVVAHRRVVAALLR